MAGVVPFPAVRRLAFVRKHAARMAELPDTTAQKHLLHQLDVQRRTMLRRGISPDVAERECALLQAAILAELQRLWFGGVA